ncbi:organic cation transporter protein isoform X1 [Octopus bimaculoides]|uniref:Major facilitator superfamily (MFS) profile domain-containing protein n=1 Tax=Octopus bimaculoides TaxID=37653 RepID=A0A0L8FNI2_OCTBM|nr:organic cation transporter protein isoform X1 [Octopus bimaculoides]XP_052827135.1 organic cation transporter protein isoform X1 [Octopus bimaculoides]XP_052827136.1 organic cation transporter protein isoform X1 [Octopus bimaculoides]|eukprot:XP_014788262.1 PREDICTED: organic cation transporter protein-like isoform X1 [Octopus bimaculoides]
MDYEATITNIGHFGNYQKLVLCLLGFFFMASGIETLLNVFIIYVPEFSCVSNHTYGNITYNSTKDECYLYPNNGTGFNTTDRTEETIACKSWVYDKSDFTATAATDMNLVCGKADKIPFINMIFMAGMFTASFIFGLLSDWKGRKLTECIVLVIQILSLFPLYFVKTSEILIVLRFFGGMSSVGIFATAFVLALEIVPVAYQTIVGLYSQIMFSVGELVVVGVAYCTREWHLLCLVIAVFSFFLLFSIFGFDESPRWLISIGKQDKAEAILGKIAKRNKKEFYVMLTEKTCNKEAVAVNGSFRDLFKSRILLYRAFNVFFNWTAVNTVYYGLVFGSASLAGNLFVSTSLMAAVELASYVVLIFLLKKTGRKPLYSSSIILAGIACFTSGFVKIWAADMVWLSTLLLLVGKFAASAAFAIIYNYTTELFPTVIRNTILGLSSCFGRIGSMAAPYILVAGGQMKSKFGVGLPVIFFGIFSIIAGLLSLFLPETKGCSLPDTFEEGENIGRKVKHKVNGEDNQGMVSD